MPLIWHSAQSYSYNEGIMCRHSQRPNVKPTRLEAWTTALRADIYKDGVVDSKRLDIIIGPEARNGKGARTICFFMVRGIHRI